MSDQFIPKSKTPLSGSSDATKRGASARTVKQLGRAGMALIVFLLALGLRAGHNLSLRHQVWTFNDAYNYLFTGNLILRTVQDPSKLHELTQPKAHQFVPDHLKLGSKELSDRISLDGLLYPSYLAGAQAIAGVNRGVTMEESRLPVCILNSVVDSFNCVLVFMAGSIAFGPAVGTVAGVLIAIYPPFIVNTQQCLSEPLASFCLSLWLLALFRAMKLTGTSRLFDAVSAALLGVSTVFLIMAKPTHLLLPLGVAIIVCGTWAYRKATQGATRDTDIAVSSDSRGYARAAIFGVISFFSAAIILLPALGVSKIITGEWMISAKRSPFENLALTFNASQDGWRAYPYPGEFPSNSHDMLRLARKAFCGNDAGELFLIGIKKVSRLWSGVTNDYQYSVLSIGYDAQVLIHRLLLVFAFVGIVTLLVRTKTIFASRRALCGFVLLSTILFHCIYLLFEAMPRYSITAVPAVIILAAYGLVGAYRSALAPAHFFAPAAILSAFLILMQTSREQCSLIAGALGKALVGLAPALSATSQSIMVLGIFGLCISLLVVGPVTLRKTLTFPSDAGWITPSIKLLYTATMLVVIVVTAVCALDRRDWTEWKCDLGKGQSIKQVIPLPLIMKSQSAVLLIDCESGSLPPMISAQVNGMKIDERPTPFAQLARNNSSILDGLMQTEFAMNKDSRAFRQWWAIPISGDCLKPGYDNEIVIANSSGTSVTVFGDYKCSDENDVLPSLWRFSFTKGYCSIERGDPRIMESMPSSNSGREAIKSTFFDGSRWTDDLSSAWGSQNGRYRIRILSADQPISRIHPDLHLAPMALLPEGVVCEVAGVNPLSMFPKSDEPRKLPSNLPANTRFEFQCEIRSISSSSESAVSLIFGDKPGWSSPWQPKSIPVTREWTRVMFSDTLPRELLPGAELKLAVYPYQSDLIYTNRKEAIASKVEIRNAVLKLLRPIDVEVSERGSKIY